jgi:hypothetical protein
MVIVFRKTRNYGMRADIPLFLPVRGVNPECMAIHRLSKRRSSFPLMTVVCTSAPDH